MVENPDGSATVTLDLDERAQQLLIEAGFQKILMDKIEQNRTARLVETLDDNPESGTWKAIKDSAE